MGIPSYFSYVLRNHFKIIRPLKQIPCQLLLIDANSFIYDVVYEHTDRIHERVFQKIMDLVKKLNASSVFVAFDGVAPLAKMKQQKQRRYKSWLLRKMLQRTSWNTNAITPGTPFMDGLDKFLKSEFAKTPYRYSGPNEVGEGEQKLFAYARANPVPNTFVYGLDADLIMLSLLHLRHSKQIFLYRETRHFSYMKGIRANEDYAFSVDDMATQICKEMYQNTHEIERAVDHYCFLCFLCGNDFLPHFPSIQIRNEGIQYLLFHFSKELLVEGTRIHWDGVKRLFTSLAKQEQVMIQENLQWKKRQRTSAKNEEEEIQLIPLRDIREVYLEDHPEEYYPFLFHQTETAPICKQYLRMLEWTLHYYHGDCKDYYLQYDFHLAPLFETLLQHIPCFEETLVEVNPEPPPVPMTQLLYVLPYEEFKDFIPEAYRPLEKKYPQLCSMNFPVHYEFCKFLWEGHVDFHYIPIRDLNHAVKDTDCLAPVFPPPVPSNFLL